MWATEEDKLADMVTQIRRRLLKFKECGQDVLMAFLVKQGVHVRPGAKCYEVSEKERTRQLRLLCSERFPEYA